MAAIDS